MLRTRVVPVLLLVGAAVSACGGGDGPSEASSDPSGAPTSSSSAPGEPGPTAAGGGACGEAFSAADPDGDGKTTFRELVPAYTACASHDEWVSTAQDYPLTASTSDGQGAVPLAEVPGVRCPFAKETGNPEATSPVCTSSPG